MKKRPFTVAMTIGLLVCLFIGSCTDVPISYTTKAPTSKVLGYWQLNNKEAIQIFKAADGNTNIIELDFDEDERKWKKGKSKKIYFASISDNKSTDYFFSYEDLPDKYLTAKFEFNSYNEIDISPLSHDFLKKYNETDDQEVVIFGTVHNFQNFVKFNKRYSSFYDKRKKEKRFRKSSIQDLDIPPSAYTSSNQEKSKNLGIWVSPYEEQYIAFYDDRTIDRFLYYGDESQWIGQSYRIDDRRQEIRVTTNAGDLVAHIYFTNEGKMVWDYMDRNQKNIVFRKIGVFEPDSYRSRLSMDAGTWSTTDGAFILSFFPRNKAVFYYPHKRSLYNVRYVEAPFAGEIAFTYSTGDKVTFDYKLISDNHLLLTGGGANHRYHLYREKDTEKFNRGAEAAVSLLNLLFSSGSSNSSTSNSSSSTDNYSGSSWLKNEHERQTIDRARGN